MIFLLRWAIRVLAKWQSVFWITGRLVLEWTPYSVHSTHNTHTPWVVLDWGIGLDLVRLDSYRVFSFMCCYTTSRQGIRKGQGVLSSSTPQSALFDLFPLTHPWPLPPDPSGPSSQPSHWLSPQPHPDRASSELDSQSENCYRQADGC